MKRAICLSLLCLAACDLSQELEGDGDGGPNGGPGASTAPSSTSPITPPGTPPADGGADADAATTKKGPVSVCVPQASVGHATVLVDGSENPYMEDVNDIAFTASHVFVLSTPWSFVGAPFGGGAVESYSMSATLPSFTAFAIGPAKAFAPGAHTAQSVGGGELPGGEGHLFALRGATSNAADRAGEIVLDGSDLVFWTRSPAILVQSTLGGASERVLAEYTSISQTQITAVALDATDIWFTTQQSNGATVTNAMLHRVPRGGGAVVDVVALTPVTSDGMTPGGILFDGSTVYLPTVPTSEFMLAYVKGTTSVTYATLGDKAVRSSPVAFDGAYFYWAETTNGAGCPGTLRRRAKNGIAAETLLTNLDRGVRIRARGGAVYLGTAAEPFRKPATDGQLIAWTP